MRKILMTAAALTALTGAAEANTFYAERGHWVVMNTSTACRATNRPAPDFNFAPFNTLQIVARSNERIGVEVIFWPGAIASEGEHAIILDFGDAKPLRLAADPIMGDYMLASGNDSSLWDRLARSETVRASAKGVPTALSFTLADMPWVLTTLRHCVRMLPPG